MYNFYNTGDQIWFRWLDNGWVPTKIVTHDGLTWSEETDRLEPLKGIDRVAHKVTIFFSRIVFNLLK